MKKLLRAIAGCSVNIEILVDMENLYKGEGAKIMVDRIPIVAAGTSVNLVKALNLNGFDAKVIALVGDDWESKLLLDKIEHELYLPVLDLRVLEGANLTVATESESKGTKFLCAKPSFIKDQEILDAAKLAIRNEIRNNKRAIRVATGVKPAEIDFAIELLFGVSLDEEELRVLNPSLPLIQGSRDAFLEMAKDVDLLVVNEIEAAKVLGIDLENVHNPEKDFSGLREISPNALVTMGDKGSCYFLSGGGHFSMPAMPFFGKGSGGAGDCYLGFFLAEFCASGNIEKAMEFASCAATMKLSLSPAASIQPEPEDVRKEMTLHLP